MQTTQVATSKMNDISVLSIGMRRFVYDTKSGKRPSSNASSRKSVQLHSDTARSLSTDTIITISHFRLVLVICEVQSWQRQQVFVCRIRAAGLLFTVGLANMLTDVAIRQSGK